MKILSKFKDYYDHVAHQYGGGDPKIVYHRTDIGKEDLNGKFFFGCGKSVTVTGMREFAIRTKRGYPTDSKSPLVCYVVVAGCAYAVLNFPNQPYGDPRPELYDPKLHRDLVTNVEEFHRGLRGTTPQAHRVIELETASPVLLDITRQIGHPVFSISQLNYDRVNSRTNFLVDHECPRLSDLKFSIKFSPEQLYQNLSYFVGNTMHGSPDLAPPVNIGDKDRIVQHGFDLKQSFRHRK